jgi:hypothetical protein
MYDGKFSHQEEILTHRKCLLMYDEFAPELIPVPHIKYEQNISYSVLLQYFKGLGHEIDYKKFVKNARSWPKKGRGRFFTFFKKIKNGYFLQYSTKRLYTYRLCLCVIFANITNNMWSN